MEEKSLPAHRTLYIDDRKKLVVTGVTDVTGFDEETVRLVTGLGALNVTGEGLQVTLLNLESGEIAVEGTLNAFSYSAAPKSGGGFFSRVFG